MLELADHYLTQRNDSRSVRALFPNLENGSIRMLQQSGNGFSHIFKILILIYFLDLLHSYFKVPKAVEILQKPPTELL